MPDDVKLLLLFLVLIDIGREPQPFRDLFFHCFVWLIVVAINGLRVIYMPITWYTFCFITCYKESNKKSVYINRSIDRLNQDKK